MMTKRLEATGKTGPAFDRRVTDQWLELIGGDADRTDAGTMVLYTDDVLAMVREIQSARRHMRAAAVELAAADAEARRMRGTQ